MYNTYGQSCSSVFGQCSNGQQCHHVTGESPKICAAGFQSKKCDMENAKMMLLHIEQPKSKAKDQQSMVTNLQIHDRVVENKDYKELTELLVLSYIKNNLKNTNDVAYLVLPRNSYRNATVGFNCHKTQTEKEFPLVSWVDNNEVFDADVEKDSR
eukprot:XP_019928366.1 PREDICTED: uncharacterized protein LOC105341927 [Crassostrea gigas]